MIMLIDTATIHIRSGKGGEGTGGVGPNQTATRIGGGEAELVGGVED